AVVVDGVVWECAADAGSAGGTRRRQMIPGSHDMAVSVQNVTEGLRRVLAGGGTLQAVTLVPVSITPRRTDRRPVPKLLRFADVSLQTYLASTEADVELIHQVSNEH
ncbi:MAG: hypothetical protein ACM3ML_00630, partial [Micromonosporaceae bacterium]